MLVEGIEDLHAIVQLISRHIPWPRENPPARLENCQGIDNILKREFLSVKLKESDLGALGIVIDANDAFASRWASVRDGCLGSFPNIPIGLPAEGLVLPNEYNQKLGVWIMPDNRSDGMLEDFLKHLVPTSRDKLWEYAQEAVSEAQHRGATFKNSHQSKANIHTWLAWQDEPGQSLGTALTRKVLDAKSSGATPFVNWFKRLYNL
jgi:hypothetical protein